MRAHITAALDKAAAMDPATAGEAPVLVCGFDSEWAGDTHSSGCAVVQLALPGRAWLVDTMCGHAATAAPSPLLEGDEVGSLGQGAYAAAVQEVLRWLWGEQRLLKLGFSLARVCAPRAVSTRVSARAPVCTVARSHTHASMHGSSNARLRSPATSASWRRWPPVPSRRATRGACLTCSSPRTPTSRVNSPARTWVGGKGRGGGPTATSLASPES